jgi:hypothetical protein
MLLLQNLGCRYFEIDDRKRRRGAPTPNLMEPLKRKRKITRSSFYASPVDLFASPGGTLYDRRFNDEGVSFV